MSKRNRKKRRESVEDVDFSTRNEDGLAIKDSRESKLASIGAASEPGDVANKSNLSLDEASSTLIVEPDNRDPITIEINVFRRPLKVSEDGSERSAVHVQVRRSNERNDVENKHESKIYSQWQKQRIKLQRSGSDLSNEKVSLEDCPSDNDSNHSNVRRSSSYPKLRNTKNDSRDSQNSRSKKKCRCKDGSSQTDINPIWGSPPLTSNGMSYYPYELNATQFNQQPQPQQYNNPYY